MKLQLSNKRIIPGVPTVWSEAGPEVDVVMDLKNLTFRPGSIDEIYSFHVLDHLFPEDTVPALTNWKNCLKNKGVLIMVVDDFEFVCRGFVGGDISIKLLNDQYSHPTQFNKEYLSDCINQAGFNDPAVSMWFSDRVGDLFNRSQSELVLSAKKHE